MFDRARYKKNALTQLKFQWKKSVLITASCAFLFMLLFFPSKAAQIKEPSQLTKIVALIVAFILISAQLNMFLNLALKNKKICFESFFKGLLNWLKSAQACFWLSLYVLLWSLLFFFPGVVKAFSYSQTLFIINEYPKIGIRKAMKISRVMTNGYKGELFVMCLSFLGWIILSCLSFGIGFLWLIPYMESSFTNCYIELKDIALKSGTILPEDLRKD